MPAAIHSAVKATLDARTYTGVITPNATTPITNVSGGTGGNIILGSIYEFGYKPTRVSDTTINIYGRTGQDGSQQSGGNGNISVRTFDLPSKTMLSDRIEVYQPSTYCVFEIGVWVMGGSVYILTHERLRADPLNQSLARNCVLKSTDGLVGRAFGSPAVQSWIDYVILHGIIDANSDGTVKRAIFGYGTPAGLFNATVASDGTIGTPNRLLSFASLTEGSAINADSTGAVIDIIRLDSGGVIRQSISTDWGQTFSTPVASNLGAVTGAKITPKLIRTANFGQRFTAMFNDRGSSNRDRCSSMALLSDIQNATWVSPAFIGTPATQGNGSGILLSTANREYLYVVARENLPNTDLYWWTFRDNFTTYNVPPAPWQ